MTMANERPGPAHGVPTLTEEVRWPQPPAPAHSAAAGEPVREPPLAPAPEPVKEPPAPPEPGPAPTPTPPPQRDPPSPAPVRATSAAAAVTSPLPPVDEEQLTERILADLQRQVDQVLEYRVREALTPILTRATDTLMRDTRNELSRSLRDLVARSVAEELRRQRAR